MSCKKHEPGQPQARAKRANLGADTSDLEHEIDRLVYQMYSLNEDEIAIAQGSESL
jgi:hypothetical protein